MKTSGFPYPEPMKRGNCLKIEMAKASDDIEINQQNVFVKTEICAELSLTMWKISTKTIVSLK